MPFGLKKATQTAALKLFSLDLHFAVIADVKHTLKTIYGSDVHVTDWLLYHDCPSKYGFEKPAKNCRDLKVREEGTAFPMLNNITWYAIDQEMVDRWLWTYRNELCKFDGFIVTHSPVFARLYEFFNKPIIMVNSCRYDQPYCVTGSMEEWQVLNNCLKSLNDRGLLIPISNNKADQEYLRLGTGIDSIHLPSLCLYTNVTVDVKVAKEHKADVYMGNFRHNRISSIPPSFQQLLADAGLLTQDKPKDGTEGGSPQPAAKSEPQSWHTLFHRKAIVHFPYEVSTMSIFEQYSAGAVLIFPSRRFYEELIRNFLAEKAGNPPITDNGSVQSLSSVYWEQNTASFRLRLAPDQLDKLPDFSFLAARCKHSAEQTDEDIWSYTFGDPQRIMPDTFLVTTEPSWWLDRADFYDVDWMPGIRFFDSWEQLLQMMNEDPDEQEHRQHLEWIKTRNDKVYAKWRELLQDKFPQLAGKMRHT